MLINIHEPPWSPDEKPDLIRWCLCSRGFHDWSPVLNGGILKKKTPDDRCHCRHCAIPYYVFRKLKKFTLPKPASFIIGYDSIEEEVILAKVNDVSYVTGLAEVNLYVNGTYEDTVVYQLYQLEHWQYTDDFTTMRNWELHMSIQLVERGKVL